MLLLYLAVVLSIPVNIIIPSLAKAFKADVSVVSDLRPFVDSEAPSFQGQKQLYYRGFFIHNEKVMTDDIQLISGDLIYVIHTIEKDESLEPGSKRIKLC